MRSMLKVTLLVSLFLLLSYNYRAEADLVSPQVRGGYYTEAEDYFLGAGVDFDLMLFSVVPNFEYLFIDNGSFYSINIDGQFELLPLPGIAGYLGGGVGSTFIKPKDLDTKSKFTYNVLIGIQVKALPFSPFAQIKYAIIKDVDDQIALTVGIHL
jgi:hypothetical protein